MPDEAVPERLYRFYSVEKAEQLLRDARVFFPSPADFNDPFDCKANIVFRASKHTRERYARELLRRKAPEMPRWVRNKVTKKGSSKEAYTRAIERFLNRIHTSVGILSLSARRDSILMWSHYAQKHAGVCLEFRNITNMGNPTIPPLKVQYSETNPELNFAEVEGLIDRQDAEGEAARRMVVECIYLTKSVEWKYEKEWRIVDILGGRGFRAVRMDALSGVIFGCHTPEAEKERIKSQIEKSGAHPTLYQALECRPSYSLEFREFRGS